MSKLHFKYGAMNSGKTDTLIKAAYNYTENGLEIIVIKPSIDTKGGQTIITRRGDSRHVDILANPDTNIEIAVKKYIDDSGIENLNCILVDEAQMLSTEQVDQLFNITKTKNISVIAYGLKTDFKTEMFPGSKRLMELADNIEKMPTMCSCGAQAEFNCRKVGDKFTFSGSQIAIDGEGEISYKSLCGICYSKAKAETTTNINEKKRILKNTKGK